MLIVDLHAEQRLVEAITPLKLDPGSSRYIFFHAPNIAAPREAVREAVVAAVQQHLQDSHANLYCLEDGDICVLGQFIPHKTGRDIITAVANQLHHPADDSWVNFLDVGHGLNQLMVMLDTKITRIRTKAEAERKQQEKEALARKRSAILDTRPQVAAEEIRQRREKRPQPWLMMIEDDVFSSKLVERALDKQYQISVFHSATGALEAYANLAPNLLFLDINLPNVTGHELLEHILALDPEAHVIMLSGNADRDNILKAMTKGARGFVAKPFTREKLLQYIERCPTIHHPSTEALHAHD